MSLLGVFKEKENWVSDKNPEMDAVRWDVARLWDTATGHERHNLTVKQISPNLFKQKDLVVIMSRPFCAISADGSKFAWLYTTTTRGGTVRVCNLNSGETQSYRVKLPGLAAPGHFVFQLSANGKTLLAFNGNFDPDKVIQVCDLTAGNRFRPIRISTLVRLWCFELSPDGSMLALMGQPSDASQEERLRNHAGWTLEVVELASGEILLSTPLNHEPHWGTQQGRHATVEFSHDGSLLALCNPAIGGFGRSNGVVTWELPSGEQRPTFEGVDVRRQTVLLSLPHPNRFLKYSALRGVMPSEERRTDVLRIWDMKERRRIGESTARIGFDPVTLATTRNGEVIVICDRTNGVGKPRIVMWDTSTGQIEELTIETDCTSLAISPDGKMPASAHVGDRDIGTPAQKTHFDIILWDVRRRE